MKPFRDLPIRQKLTVLIVVITTAALLLAGVGIIAVDSILFRGYLERDLETFSRIIGDNSAASLAFDDPQSASEVLAALRARSHILVACLLRQNGSTLAMYARPGTSQACPAAGPDGVRSTLDRITVSRAILAGGARVGTLTMIYDLGEIGDRVRVYGFTVVGVLLVSVLLTVLLSSRLRDTFVTPILHLAGATELVSKSRDYNVRATKLSNDEVGTLASAFNEMLAGIQSRDTDLRQSLAEREEALIRLAEANRELQRSNEELAQSNQDLERFAFIASHDMQEPLRMVTVYSQLLVKLCAEDSEAARAYREYIVTGTHNMRDLISDLLAYVEITTAPRQAAHADMNVVLERVRNNLKLAIRESAATITTEPLPNVALLESHAVSLLQNLIGNSIKYRSAEPPRIHLTAQNEDGVVRFALTDNGIGIEPEYHADIFVAFKRLHGKDIPGTGIGLAICQRIVTRYGGRIWVESEPGKGSTFRFTLPPEEIR